jgi:hypothetical protein
VHVKCATVREPSGCSTGCFISNATLTTVRELFHAQSDWTVGSAVCCLVARCALVVSRCFVTSRCIVVLFLFPCQDSHITDDFDAQ